MRKTPLLLTACGVLVAAAAACTVEKMAPQRHAHGAGTAPRFSNVNDPTKVDTGGGRLPDLYVDYDATAQHWLVRDEKILQAACSAQEGNVEPGTRRIIRFTVTTPNQGDADVAIGSPLKHADPNGDGDFSDNDGMYEFASCHNHFHFQNYATYKLIDPATGKVWKSAKRGFCMLDTDPNPRRRTGEPPAGDRNYYNCGTKTVDGFQGVSHGWGDTYVWQLAGQYFVLDGGDHQAVVPPGNYVIEITVNPGYAPAKGASCPLVTDANGLCHNFKESDYANNTTRIPVSIPDHPGKDGYGPLKGSKDAEINEKPN